MSSPNCGDKVEVQLLFMAFFIYICYMAKRLQKIEANLNTYNSNITTFLENVVYDHPDKRIEDLCYSSLSSPDSVITFDTEFPDNVIERIKMKIEIVKNQLSCLKKENYRLKAYVTKVQKHLDKMKKEMDNPTSWIPQVNGGRRRKSRKKRRKRKSRKKRRRRKRKSRRKTRNKKGGHHEAIVLGALALSKIFKNKKKTRKKRRR